VSQFVTNTPLAQMQPIGPDSQRISSRLEALISRHMDPDHAGIFADPVEVSDRSGIDWYVETDGDVIALSDLGDEEAQTVRSKLQARLEAIRSKAEELRDSAPDVADMLYNATLFTGDGAVFAVRHEDRIEPLLVSWGYKSSDPVAVRAFNVSTFAPERPAGKPQVSRVAAAPVASQSGHASPPGSGATAAALPAASVMVASEHSPWSSWLLPLLASLALLLLFVIVIAFLLPACGLRTPFGTFTFGYTDRHYCNSLALAAEAQPSPQDTGVELERELAVLTAEYQRRRIGCLVEDLEQAQLSPVEPLPEPEPLNEDQFDERVDQRGDAQATLIWDTPDDLDLMVRCPNGSLIKYSAKIGCGGVLDIDRNASGPSDQPVENITFENGIAGPRPYPVLVNLYRSRTGRYPVPFEIRIRDANGTRIVQGQINRPGETVQIGEMQP